MATGKRAAARQITLTERRIRALALRKIGTSYRAIADLLGCDVRSAHRYVAAGLAALLVEQRAEAEELRALELARLDDLTIEAYRILKADHPLVSGGKILSGFTNDGKPIGLTDVGPKLAAIRELRLISESRRKLLGLDVQPDDLPPGDMAIILRWHDGRIIDATPVDHHSPIAPSLPEPDSAESSAVPYRVLWQTMGQEPSGGDVEPENGAE